MIGVKNTGSNAFKYVVSALVRSFTNSQVVEIDKLTDELGVLVLISPDNGELKEAMATNNIQKIVVFGTLPEEYSTKLGFEYRSWPSGNWPDAPTAETYQYSESPAKINYVKNIDTNFSPIESRAMERFDFTDEWNNLGFGAVRHRGDIWSLSAPIHFDSQYTVANVDDGGATICTYSALVDCSDKSILWFNREVGPLDSYEWQLVEIFLSSYKASALICYPALLELPQGHDAVVTMRLDCDEDIESSRDLWNAYCEEKIPFSLAVHTSNLNDTRHFALMQEVQQGGGAILSHTATHAPNWGGTYESALSEAKVSAQLIENVIKEPVQYAVSPFHHTPIYALQALSDAGYLGCIGGIIKNDPEFLTFNGGNLPDLPNTFIAHSQQVMLHGDCLLKDGGDPIRIYKEAFDLAKSSYTMFGYLDHPFSERYQYGWASEEQRVKVHIKLIEYIRMNSTSPCFLNEVQAMEFIQDKAKTLVSTRNNEPVIYLEAGYHKVSPLVPKLLYKGIVKEVAFSES
ncbi:hypothetical protein LYZ37_00685 [Vibrio tubiashii]|uniref:hypothetical protein n=1 Tax=Vibrio tubiashii TaxID=29498 RepID=UPI00234E8E7C|nr:hypothetical protein [Vibrio tubiashii]WCP67275.1 hypothetical protein LYZ37_00685 [Vibrio tubiashii]